MDPIEFEQSVLELLFEGAAPLTAAQVAYETSLPVRTAERLLARLVEDGVLNVRVGRGDVAVYDIPGRGRKREGERRRLAGTGPSSETSASTPGDVPPAAADPSLAEPTALRAVLLSVVVPGAGHIYTGRSGAGAAWMACTLAGYACFFLPGLFLHGLCLVSAAHSARA